MTDDLREDGALVDVERPKMEPEIVKWKPIETAPKDGTQILAYGTAVEGYPKISWDPKKPRVPHSAVIYWKEGWYDRDEEVEPGLYRKVKTKAWDGWWPDPQQFFPTHWMPLPEPPK